MSCRLTSLAALALVGAAALSLSAHDFWLVPDAMAVGRGNDIVVRGQTSSAFPTSESAVTVDRITDARVMGATGEETISARSIDGVSLLLRHRPGTGGQKVISVSLGWRHVKETAESFRKYLVLEGAEDALKRYEQAGKLPTDAIVRRYAKYAKTVVEFGDGPRAFHRLAGAPLEFVPLTDPATQRATTTFRVRILFQGQPLANARVHAGRAPVTGQPATKDHELISSADGVVTIPAVSGGLWNVRAIHVVPAPAGADADWDVHWASFVFGVR
jgi:uncharacterized GH25 family protein